MPARTVKPPGRSLGSGAGPASGLAPQARLYTSWASSWTSRSRSSSGSWMSLAFRQGMAADPPPRGGHRARDGGVGGRRPPLAGETGGRGGRAGGRETGGRRRKWTIELVGAGRGFPKLPEPSPGPTHRPAKLSRWPNPPPPPHKRSSEFITTERAFGRLQRNSSMDQWGVVGFST